MRTADTTAVFFPGIGFKDKENGKICQPSLIPGFPQKREQGLHIAENDGYSGKQSEICVFFIVHSLYCRVKFRRSFFGASGFYSFYYNFIGKAHNGPA